MTTLYPAVEASGLDHNVNVALGARAEPGWLICAALQRALGKSRHGAARRHEPHARETGLGFDVAGELAWGARGRAESINDSSEGGIQQRRVACTHAGRQGKRQVDRQVGRQVGQPRSAASSWKTAVEL